MHDGSQTNPQGMIVVQSNWAEELRDLTPEWLERRLAASCWLVPVTAKSGVRWVLLSRLQQVETLYVMTVQKYRDSGFAHTALAMPDTLSAMLHLVVGLYRHDPGQEEFHAAQRQRRGFARPSVGALSGRAGCFDNASPPSAGLTRVANEQRRYVLASATHHVAPAL